MATYSSAKSVTATLTASTVDTVTLNTPFNVVTVQNESAAGVISFTVSGVAATVGGNDTYDVAPGQSLTVTVGGRQQGETSQVNGVAGPTWSLALDGTPVPNAWVTSLSGSKFSRGVDTNNILTNPAAGATSVISLISSGTPQYTVTGG